MSIKDYLISDRIKDGAASYFSINEILAHSLIAQTCLAYILDLENLTVIDYQSTQEPFPLALYAAEYWISHMSLAHDDCRGTIAWELMTLVFSSNEHDSAHWVGLRGPFSTTLQAAAYHGHNGIVLALLEQGENVNQYGGFIGSALQAASLRGHEETVSLLIAKGADINAVVGGWGTALGAAALGGHSNIVRYLLDSGADVNAQAGQKSSASSVQPLTYRGHDISRLVFDRGSDAPASSDHITDVGDIVPTRITKVLDVDERGRLFDGALQAASLGGHEDILRMLLESGADVNAVGGGCLGTASTLR